MINPPPCLAKKFLVARKEFCLFITLIPSAFTISEFDFFKNSGVLDRLSFTTDFLCEEISDGLLNSKGSVKDT